MASLLLRKSTIFSSQLNHHFLSGVFSSFSKFTTSIDNADVTASKTSNDERQNHNAYSIKRVPLSPLFRDQTPISDLYDIELVDNDTWHVKSGLIHASNGLDRVIEEPQEIPNGAFCEQVNDQGDSDFDEVDNMRIRGNLFYKIDRDSKEYEEYSYDFHRKKSSKKNVKNSDDCKPKQIEKLPQIARNEKVYSLLPKNIDGCDDVEKKKVRTTTFNQLTGPYHEPFCLDIYISKASIRACIIHRATSKVVAVAHSISKDIKFDLPSTRNATACATVGAILAQRALEDDIHNVIYTPRKGERLEGKLQIVLQSIIDNGMNVKVKLKQRKFKKGAGFP